MHLLDGDRGLDLPLEREATGRISAAKVEEVSNKLRAFFEAQGSTVPQFAYCSIPVRGVGLRRVSIPDTALEDARRFVGLQLETQMPVSPRELAWGCTPVLGRRTATKGAGALQEFLVVAVKKEFLEDYIK